MRAYSPARLVVGAVTAVSVVTSALTSTAVVAGWFSADEWWSDLGRASQALFVILSGVTVVSLFTAAWALTRQPVRATSFEDDRRTFDALTTSVPADTVEFVRHWDFGASFRLVDVSPVLTYCEVWRRPENEFLDPELESLRVRFGEAVEEFDHAVHQFMWSERPDRLSIPVEWKHSQLDRWLEAQETVNRSGEAVGATYEALIRTARRRLAN